LRAFGFKLIRDRKLFFEVKRDRLPLSLKTMLLIMQKAYHPMMMDVKPLDSRLFMLDYLSILKVLIYANNMVN